MDRQFNYATFNSTESLSGIETFDSTQGFLQSAPSIQLNPYQGLKHRNEQPANCARSPSIQLNPYQGLKQTGLILIKLTGILQFN